jgi:BMFP domain-containing protein YqiC
MPNSAELSEGCELAHPIGALFWRHAWCICPKSGHFVPGLSGVGDGRGEAMEQFRIDELARKLFESVPPAFRSMQQDLEANFRSVLRSSLSKLDVVTREEFDTQTKVLERTRSKLEALEKKVAELEAASAPTAPPPVTPPPPVE